MAASTISPALLAHLAKSHVRSEKYLRLGRDIDSVGPQDVNPNKLTAADHQRLARLDRVALTAWPKLVSRFGIGARIEIDPITGKWTNPDNGKTGKGVVALLMHLCRASLEQVAVVLSKVIRVRKRQPVTTPKTVEMVKAEPTVAADQTEPQPVPTPMAAKPIPAASSINPPRWLTRLFAVIGRVPQAATKYQMFTQPAS